jgi:glycosidase
MIDELLNKPFRTSRLLAVLLMLTLSAYGCKKSTPGFVDPPKPPVVIEVDPAQHGTPFASVPDRRDVSLYQVNMRVFSNTGNFKGVIDRLDSIKALGVNVIYLMPIYPLGVVKSVNSPYCIKDYKSVNPEFGTLEDLRALVDGAHSRNMSVLLDWVANHTSFDHTWTKDKSWYLQDGGGNILSPPNMGWNDVAQLNFNNSAMRQTMIKAMKHWVFTANVDGFRFDYSDGPPVDFWKQAVDTLRNIKSHKLLLLAEGGRSSNYSAGFDYNFGFGFFDKMKSIFGSNLSVKQIDNMNTSDYSGAADGQQIVRYLTNHDVNSSDGTPLELFGGKKGSMAAFVVVSYMKSIPMIYNGQEVGTPVRLTFPFTSTKINWTINPDVTAEYKKVIAFRNSSDAIRRGQLTSYSSDDVCAFTKESGAQKVLVLSNLRNSNVAYAFPESLKNTTWKDAFTGASITLGTSISLDAFSYKILKN